MAKADVLKGEFFISDLPDNRLTGIITINEDGNFTLEVFGSFNMAHPVIDTSKRTIWGQLFDGRAVSILDCSRKQKKTTFGVSEVELWGGFFVLLGALVPNFDVPYFDSISVEIERLREWVAIDGGELEFKPDLKAFKYTYEDPPSILFRIKDTLSGSIYFKNELWVGLYYKNQAEQFTRLSLESAEKLSLVEFIQHVRNFRKLISFFVGQKLRIERMVLTSPEAQIKLINPTRVEMPFQAIELIFHDNERYGTPFDLPLYYVNYRDIAPDFSTLIANWYELAESSLSPVTDILLDTITDHYHYDENAFLRVWQGVEAFHRIVLQDTQMLKKSFDQWFNRISDFVTDEELLKKIQNELGHAYETKARRRLKEILTANKDLLELNVTAKVLNKWITEIIDTRNYLTHLDPESIGKKAPPQHLYNYTGLLKALLVLLVLRRLGVREEILAQVVKHQSFNLGLLKKQHLTI